MEKLQRKHRALLSSSIIGFIGWAMVVIFGSWQLAVGIFFLFLAHIIESGAKKL